MEWEITLYNQRVNHPDTYICKGVDTLTKGDTKMDKHNQHVTDFINSDRFDVEAYVDKFITDYNRACYQSGNVDKQV